MLRYLQLALMGVLFALAAFAAGIAEEVPAAVQFIFVACLALLFGALLAATTPTTPPVDTSRAN